MKKRKILILAVVSAGLFICSSCDDLLSVEDKAEKAAAEMCECIKTKSVDTCKKNLDDDYGHYANNDKFIKAFNNAQNCGVTVYKEKN